VTVRVDDLLLEVLDAEWAAQSDRRRPLAPTREVREAVELAVARAPRGIVGLSGALDSEAATADALVDRVRDRLPVAADAWTLRALARLRTLPRGANGAAPPQEPDAPDGAATAALRQVPVMMTPILRYEPPARGWRAAVAARFGRRRAAEDRDGEA
jgi:hypothetical protein